MNYTERDKKIRQLEALRCLFLTFMFFISSAVTIIIVDKYATEELESISTHSPTPNSTHGNSTTYI